MIIFNKEEFIKELESFSLEELKKLKEDLEKHFNITSDERIVAIQKRKQREDNFNKQFSIKKNKKLRKGR